jgi:mono/diheme cytochrome c family protein
VRAAFALVLGGLALAASGTRAVTAAAPQAASAAPSTAAPRAVLDKYCVTCHNPRLKTAGLALDQLDVVNVAAGAETWEKVVRKLRAGAMPPPGAPRPDQNTSEQLAAYFEGALERASLRDPNPGRTEAFHRLNQAEYHNAIRDLLALDIDVSALVPADAADQHGFDNMAGVLSMSPVLLERYVSAARRISRLAVGIPPKGATIDTYTVPVNLLQDDRLSDDLPFGSRGGTSIRHHFPVDGEYVIKLRLQTNYVSYIRGLHQTHKLDLRIDGARIKQFRIGGDAPGKPAPNSYEGNIFGSKEWEAYAHHADDDLEVRVPVKAGPHLVGVDFPREMWEAEGVLQPRQFEFALAINGRQDDNPSLGSLEIDGPYSAGQPGDTPSRRRIFVCQPSHRSAPETPASDDGCARKILSTLARRAYRRPVTDADLRTLIEFYRAGRQQGNFDAGIQMAIERLLADPEFLFRVERAPAGLAAGASYRISDLDLASRLSFFLWSSIPDDELIDAAAQGKLKEPAVLERQVRRMLADQRSRAMVDNFVGQWLLVRDINSVYPDPATFPEFDDNLRAAFEQETERFVESQLRENRSIVDLLSADYTFLNERLARHYGIPNVYGTRFRRVQLADPAERGGLLGQGSLLTVTSYANRTSPVLRGKWLLANILGTPVPPPPPDVPSLKETGENGKPASVRERLEQHRRNPVCSSCHSQMDPLGFALENFDAVGKWRDTAEGGAPVDASAALPNGARFQGLNGLREVLLARREQFVRTVTEKLLTYALGRGVEYYDLPVIRRIVRGAGPDDRWSAIISGITASTPFQMRLAEPGNGKPAQATAANGR